MQAKLYALEAKEAEARVSKATKIEGWLEPESSTNRRPQAESSVGKPQQGYQNA